jgi:hypothetical protein
MYKFSITLAFQKYALSCKSRFPVLQDDPVYRPATVELFNRTQLHIMTRSATPELPALSWYNIPIPEKICQNDHKLYQICHKIYQIAVNRPNDLKIYQHLSFKDNAKCSQIWIFCSKKYHLATLSHTLAYIASWP